MNRKLIEVFTGFLFFGLFVFPDNVFPESVTNSQDPTVGKILKGIYPYNCKSARAREEIKWGIPLALGLPHNVRLISVFPSKSYMGEENRANEYPITKMQYGDYLTCLVSGRLSNNEMINGFYTQWTNLAPEPNLAHGNKVGTYIQFNGILYKSGNSIKNIVNSGNYNFTHTTKYLGEIYPRKLKQWVDLK